MKSLELKIPPPAVRTITAGRAPHMGSGSMEGRPLSAPNIVAMNVPARASVQ